jgi:hypothetical protein
MEDKMDTNKGSEIELAVKAGFQESSKGEKRPKAAAYAFSQGGRFLAKHALNADGEAKLRIPGVSGATAIRVMVGPENDKDGADLADLVRVGAVESHVRVERATKRLAVNLQVLTPIWLPWLEFCCVRGTLVKGYSNGVQLPVCNALVEVYEVEPWWIIIQRIPPDVLANLRQIVAGPVSPVGPGPNPGPERPIATSLAQASVMARSAAKAAPMRAEADFGALRSVAANAGDFAFRQALVDQEILIRPILCWLWPEFVTLCLLGTVATDQCGAFELCFFKGFGNTGPTNLYFKAKVRFLPLLLPDAYIYIYDPTPIGCHTWWNYPCGSEVQLVTTSPWAYACPPCMPVIAPDNWVMFTAIGNTSLSTIQGTGQALVGSTTSANLGLDQDGAPWGGTLLPRLDFDDSLRLALGVQYYSVSWRSGTSGPFAAVMTTGAINRSYIYTPGGSSTPVISPYFLGPQPVGPTLNLFEIPPAVPPQGQWTIVDAVGDTASAQFATDVAGVSPGITYPAGLPVGSDQSGLFQIKVDLYDAAGNPVDIAAKGIVYVIPTSADLTHTITTADASTIAQPGGGTLVQGSSLIVSLYLNNNRCHAAIDAPMVNGTAADDCCGVLKYTPGASVDMAWTALQVGNFATFNLDLWRGAYETWADDGQAVTGGSFSSSQSVAALMAPHGVCTQACTLAGFSENLGVYAEATDGWERLSNYDSYAVWAFVLSPD